MILIQFTADDNALSRTFSRAARQRKNPAAVNPSQGCNETRLALSNKPTIAPGRRFGGASDGTRQVLVFWLPPETPELSFPQFYEFI